MDPFFITCSCCGAEENIDNFVKYHTDLVKVMRRDRVCYKCAFWNDWMSNRQPNDIVANHTVFRLGKDLVPLKHASLRKQYPHYLLNPSEQTIFGVPEWAIVGEVPPDLYQLIPDDYTLIDREVAKRVRDYSGTMCLYKGCFDRYHCYWYRKDIAEPDGPWNIIPDNHVTGSEGCPSFINKNDYGLL